MATAPWEFSTDQEALCALARQTSREDYVQDRYQSVKDLQTRLQIGRFHKGFEIGSGDGIVAKLLSTSCNSIECADISSSFLAAAQATCKGIANIQFHKIRNRSLDFLPARSYDFGYSLNVFIHLNPYDIHLYLQEVARVLKPGGRFYFDACTLGPQTLALFRQQAATYGSTLDARGLLNFNHPQLISVLAAESGFTIEPSSLLGAEGWLGFLLVKPLSAR